MAKSNESKNIFEYNGIKSGYKNTFKRFPIKSIEAQQNGENFTQTTTDKKNK